MPSIARILLPIIGIWIAGSIGSPANRTFDLILGAAVGFAIADLWIMRARLDDLGREIARLATELRRRQQAPAPPAAHPEPPPEFRPSAELPQQPRAAELRPHVIPNRPWQEIEPLGTPRCRNQLCPPLHHLRQRTRRQRNPR
jgi:hypothetical protein